VDITPFQDCAQYLADVLPPLNDDVAPAQSLPENPVSGTETP
jgi:hypothetical protein